MEQQQKMKLWVATAAVTMMVMVGVSLGGAGYTVAITNLDFEFDKNASTGIVTISGSYNWQLNTNYTTLKQYHYAVISGEAEKLCTKTLTYSNYINGSNGTNGLVSQTFTMTFDPPSGLQKDETIVVYAKIYNATLEVDNLITSKSHGESYPYAGVATSRTTTTTGAHWYEQPTKVAIVAFAGGAAIIVVVIVVLKFVWGPRRQVP